MILVRIIKNWDWPDLMRQTPHELGIWDDVQFTLSSVEECDYVVMLNNNMNCESIVKCPPENIWALMQEPYVKGFTDWMVEGHKHYFKVFTNYKPLDDSKYVISHPAVPWHINRPYGQLVELSVPPKPKTISWIVGNARNLPGHFKRLCFLKFIQDKSPLDIDLFGRAVRVIDDKWDGLADYKYSLAVENSSSPDYWTEKLADCFLTWTMPFYYGCTNLEKYFPEESFIRINIDEPVFALEQIKTAIKNNEWEKRLPALKKARELVLNQYQIFPHLVKQIKSHHNNNSNRIINRIPPYKKSINTHLNRIFFRIKMAMMNKRCTQ